MQTREAFRRYSADFFGLMRFLETFYEALASI
jgi:hypothetical protein